MRPFIKWLGGKAQLLPELQRRMPQHIGIYIEPFVGGGSLFFGLHPNKGIINDANPKLVNLYISIRDNMEELIESLICFEREYNTLTSLDAKQDFYYQSRTEFNAHDFDTNLTVEDAARFIFLNKTNFNGLYRENANGEYNAAFGYKECIRLFDESNLNSCSSALQDAAIMSGDFEDACRDLTARDFVYFDPPYYSTFDGYQKSGFNENDHVRLHELFKRLTECGVYCMLSNSNTNFVKNLYAGNNIAVVSSKRMINRDGNGRKCEELIITNYKSNQIIKP